VEPSIRREGRKVCIRCKRRLPVRQQREPTFKQSLIRCLCCGAEGSSEPNVPDAAVSTNGGFSKLEAAPHRQQAGGRLEQIIFPWVNLHLEFSDYVAGFPACDAIWREHVIAPK